MSALRDAAERAAKILDSVPTDAARLAHEQGVSDKVRAAAKEFDKLPMPNGTGPRLDRAKRMVDFADKTTSPLKGFALARAMSELIFVITEAAAT